MSIEDLQDAGVLLPEEEWGDRALDSTMSRAGAILTGTLAVAAGAGMYLGGGGALTWISASVFLADLLAFTVLAWRAVNLQNRRHPARPAPPAGGEGGAVEGEPGEA